MRAAAEYRRLVERTLADGRVSVDDVDDVLDAIGGAAGEALPTDQTSLAAALDCHHAVRQMEPHDGAHPWNDAGPLRKIGHDLEAAFLYVRAAELFAIDAREGTGALGDEEDWAQAALWHGVHALIACRRPVTAALVARTIEDREYRAQAENAVRGWLDS